MEAPHEHSRTTCMFSATPEARYFTTAINYTNGPPHVGHAYEAVTTDVIARYHRVYGRDVFFLTGTDEHGQKVAKSAEMLDRSPQAHCDFYAQGFKDLNSRLNISNDFFVRTTSEEHKRVAKRIWTRVRENGDLYVTKYEGWYDPYAEQYVTDADAELSGYKDEAGRDLERKTSEEAYFFRMSKYKTRLLRHIRSHPDFIQPVSRRNEILEFLTSQELRDLCVSRSNLTWGVEVPFDPEYKGDSKHVMYVWFDALTNYLSGCGAFDETNSKASLTGRAKWWPNVVHFIGKDIARFHTVYWPCMLMSANVPLPKCVFSHGFVSDAHGQKMSKSLGNVVDPNEILNSYPSDSLRWYLASSAPFGSDLAFDERKLVDSHNNVLLKSFGNLVRRACTLNQKYSNCVVDGSSVGYVPFDFESLTFEFESALCVRGGFDIKKATEALYAAVTDTNAFLQNSAPWKRDDDLNMQKNVVRATLEAIYVLAHFLEPFCPSLANDACTRLGTDLSKISQLSWDFDNLDERSATYVGEVLVNEARVGAGTVLKVTEEEKAAMKLKKAEDLEKARAAKKLAKQQRVVSKTADDDRGPHADVDFLKMEIRVGEIVECRKHPDSDKLLCEKIDVGESQGPRDVASGIQRSYASPDELVNTRCFLITNLKPAKLAGFTSNGMVLCYTDDENVVKVLSAPQDVEVGSRVSLKSLKNDEPPSGLSAKKLAKKKILKKVLPKLVLSNGVAKCGEDEWTIQPVMSDSTLNSQIA